MTPTSTGARIAAAIEEPGAATREIARAVQQGTSDASDSAGRVAEEMGETVASIRGVTDGVAEVRRQGDGLRDAVPRLIGGLRAARRAGPSGLTWRRRLRIVSARGMSAITP